MTPKKKTKNYLFKIPEISPLNPWFCVSILNVDMDIPWDDLFIDFLFIWLILSF